MMKEKVSDLIDNWCCGCYDRRELHPGDCWSSDAISGQEVDELKEKIFALLVEDEK